MMGKDFENPFGLVAPKSGRTKMMSELIDSMVMPGIQGGPLMHVIAAKAVAFKEDLAADCPFPNATRCSDNRGAVSFTTGMLSSHDYLGINAPPESRIDVEVTMSCSPIRVDDLVAVEEFNGDDWVEFFMGPVLDSTKRPKTPYTFAAPRESDMSLKSYGLM